MIQALGVNMALQAGSQIVKGLSGIVSGIAGSRQRRNEQAAATRSYNSAMAKFDSIDTSNPYANITNPYANLTVNQQQADFMAQQTNQAAANTMSTMNAAAGGSGIAALAQAMANQQSQNLQKASASIGQQEAANQKLMAQGAMQTQMARAQGQYMSQRMQAGQATTQLSMAQQRKAAADLARQQATAAMVGGIGNIAGGVMGAVGADKALKSVDHGGLKELFGGNDAGADVTNAPGISNPTLSDDGYTITNSPYVDEPYGGFYDEELEYMRGIQNQANEYNAEQFALAKDSAQGGTGSSFLFGQGGVWRNRKKKN